MEATLSKMTLEEKIGQMTELAIDVLGGFVDGEFQLDEAKLRKAIAEYKVGSFLNAPGPVAQDKDKWQEIIGTIQSMSMKEIGIPCIYGLDQNHGTTYTLDGTLFPQREVECGCLKPYSYELISCILKENGCGKTH